MATEWRILLLGEFRAVQGDREVTRFRSHKTAVLLATLACRPQHLHPREELLAQLWPEAAPADARNNLSVALSSLRTQFEPPAESAGSVIRADRRHIGLNPENITTDLGDFERALDAADRISNDSDRILALEAALAYYGGPLLPGYYEDWLVEERRRLVERSLTAMRALVRLLVQAQELNRALEWARRAVAADPIREETQRDLIRLLVATGQTSAALQQYRDLEERLRLELDAEPSAATRRMVSELQARLQAPIDPPIAPLPKDRPSPASGPTVASEAPSLPAPDPRLAPNGTVTFAIAQLVEGPDAEAEGDEALGERLRAQQDLLQPLWERYHGYVCERTRDTWEVAFSNARDALAAAIAGQQALNARLAEKGAPSPVRMALHTGDVTPHEGRYYTRTLLRAARLLQAGHGGQILCSEVTAGLLRADLGADVSLVDLGVYRLFGLTAPERVFQAAYPDQPSSAFSPLRAEFATASHLPLPVSRFFGRESELSRLVERLPLPQTRLVTLTGPGGAGKTRLALEAARRLVERYAGAVWFVPLGDVVREDLITNAVADAVGVPLTTGQDPFSLVAAALTAQTGLLIMDNLEHLLAPAADWIAELMIRAPTVTCLATSRERLNLGGEVEIPLPPLPTPPGVRAGSRAEPLSDGASDPHPAALFAFPSVALFVDRCQAVQPDFSLTSENAAPVATLCNGLEGLPLAIELAAARIQVATPLQMVAMLGRRFDLLVSRRRDLAMRHRTMRATIEWSYNLLAPELQRFFRLLSIFRGGWSLEAAEEVCDEPIALDYLAQLREGSLIVTQERGGEMRYRMLETLREYAGEQLGQGEERLWARDRHRNWFVALAEQASPNLLGAQQRHWLERLETEHDNLRAALSASRETSEGVEADLRLIGALWLFWYIRSHVREGREQCLTALARPGTEAFPAARASALNAAGNLTGSQDFAQARAFHEESLALRQSLGDSRGVAGSLNNLGNVSVHLRDYPAARAYFEQALSLNRSIGNRAWEASNLHNLGEIARVQEQFDEATARFEAALNLNTELGNQDWRSTNLTSLGEIAQQRGDLVTARTRYEEALAINRSLGNRASEAYSLYHLGGVFELLGDREDAIRCHEQACEINREMGDETWEVRNRQALDRLTGNAGA